MNTSVPPVDNYPPLFNVYEFQKILLRKIRREINNTEDAYGRLCEKIDEFVLSCNEIEAIDKEARAKHLKYDMIQGYQPYIDDLKNLARIIRKFKKDEPR